MIEDLKNLIIKYKDIILYIFFGGLTTLVNWLIYYLLYERAGVPNVPSDILAWAGAVAFAFVTNKIWVFGSRSWKAGTALPELGKFVSCRLASGLLELAIMFLTVDLLKWNGMLMKILVGVLVVILNYAASKLFIFKGGKT